MMALDEDMVVRQRRGQQVLADNRSRLDPNLRAAHVLLELAARHFDVHRQEAIHIIAQLDERVVARSQLTVDSDTDTGLEMARELMLLGHRQRDRTLSEQDLTVRLDTCGVGHPCRLTRQFLTSHHRQQHRYIALATGRNTKVVELGHCQTAGVLTSRKQIEATDRDTVEFIFLHDLFDALLDRLSTLHAPLHFAQTGQLLERDVHHLGVHFLQHLLVIYLRSNEPVG